MSYNQTSCACAYVFFVFVPSADSFAGHQVLFHSLQRWDDHRDFDGLVEKVHQTRLIKLGVDKMCISVSVLN